MGPGGSRPCSHPPAGGFAPAPARQPTRCREPPVEPGSGCSPVAPPGEILRVVKSRTKPASKREADLVVSFQHSVLGVTLAVKCNGHHCLPCLLFELKLNNICILLCCTDADGVRSSRKQLSLFTEASHSLFILFCPLSTGSLRFRITSLCKSLFL